LLLLKVRLAFFTAFSVTCLGQGSQSAQLWIDQNGRKIEASFLKINQENLILDTFGQELVVPLEILSPASRSLAYKMSELAPQGGESIVPTWTDVQGRVIRANFIRADAYSITLEMDDQNFTLPMEMLDKKSMHQAFIFSQDTDLPKKVSPKKTKAEIQPSSANQIISDSVKSKPASTPNLTQPQLWKSVDGRTITAVFIDQNDQEITLSIKPGKEVKMALSKLSPESKMLSKTLKELKDKEGQKRAQEIALRKKMKVPKLTDEDLKKIHSLKNDSNQTVKAQFIGATDQEVIIGLGNKPTRPITMKWDDFNTESQALLEGLRRLKKSMITPARGNLLASFSRGPFQGYNSILESEHYNVALHANGENVMIWLKYANQAKVSKPFIVKFDNSYNYRALKRDNKGKIERHSNGKPIYRWPVRSRPITKFESFIEPSNNRENITLNGKLNNGSKFEYNMELNKKGLRFWSKLEEKKPAPPKTELDTAFTPTKLFFTIRVPGLISDAKNVTAEKVEQVVSDASVSLRPQSGTLRKFPYKEKWTITKKKYKGEKFSTLQSMIFEGYPYGKNKLTVLNPSTSDMSIGFSYGYGILFPFQGLSIRYGGRGNNYSQQISKSRALKIELTEKK